MQAQDFSGVSTALVTPMTPEGAVDWASLEALVEQQISEGIQGLVAVGTTGESPTLSHDEHAEVIQRVMQVANGRVPVIAGTGSNSTQEAVELTRAADAIGVDAMLQVAPYYNKPTQEGLFRHFSAVAEATERPIILYSIPGRCVIDISNDTCLRLYEQHPHVLGVKEAGGSCDKVSDLRLRAGEDYLILCGDDGLTLPFIAAGAEGVISVASNWLAAELVEMVRLARGGDLQAARAIHLRCYPLFRDLFIEPNPVPVKALLKESGLIASDACRPPLYPLSQTNRARVLASAKLARPSLSPA